jgi:hypothetical protein
MLSTGLHDRSKTARLSWGESQSLSVHLVPAPPWGLFLEVFIERSAQKEVPFMRSPIQFERLGKTPKILLRMRQVRGRGLPASKPLKTNGAEKHFWTPIPPTATGSPIHFTTPEGDTGRIWTRDCRSQIEGEEVFWRVNLNDLKRIAEKRCGFSEPREAPTDVIRDEAKPTAGRRGNRMKLANVCLWHPADIECRHAVCPLLGVKRTSLIRFLMSANDPFRTLPPKILKGNHDPLGPDCGETLRRYCSGVRPVQHLNSLRKKARFS